MPAQPIRFKEAVIQLTVDGKKQTGTFENIRNLTVTPRAEIINTKYAGEARARPDLEIDGYDFSFQCNESDGRWMDLWKLYDVADAQSGVFPNVSLAISTAYRGGGRRTIVLYGQLVMKLDDRSLTDGEYAQQNWSGSCQYMQG